MSKKYYRIDLPADYVRSILDYDPETGFLHWKRRTDVPNKWNVRWVGKKAGQVSNGYICISINMSAGYYAHRLAWLIIHGNWPVEQLDHINGIRDDNRLCNLRLATNAENNCNRGKQSNNTSGYRGVYWCKQSDKWRARIKVDGKQVHLGTFKSPEVAGRAYRDAEIKYRNGFHKID